MIDMVIKKFRLDELNPAKYNPRQELKPGDKDFEKLERSIKTFGYVEPIVVNIANSNTVISGHQRLSVLKHIGESEADCVVVELNEMDERALNIAMNKVNGRWDEVKLTDLLKEFGSAGYDATLTGFEPIEMEELFKKYGGEEEVKEDDFDVETELKQPAFSKPGDMWFLGKHRVICGDSTLPETFKQLMGGEKANLLATDPPYFVNLENTSGKITNDDLQDKEAYEFLMKAFTNFRESLADDASTYVFYASSKSRIFYDAYEDSGFRVSLGLNWKKDRFVLSRTDWKPIAEPIIFGWKKKGKHCWYGDQKQPTVFEFPRIKNSKEEGFGHPSSKPVALMAYLIQQSTMTNGIVLDGFLGSASTMMACEQIGRVCRGVEFEPKFVDVAVKRYIYGKEGKYDDVYVIRDGQKLMFDEVATFEPQEEG